MVIIGSVPKPIMHGSTIVVVVLAAAAAAVIPVESPRERKRWASCVSSTKYKTDPYEIYFFLSTKQKKNYPWISLGSSVISRVVFDAFSLSHSSRNCLSAERGDYVFKGECREGGREREKGIVRNLCRLSRVMAVRNLRQSSVFFYDYFSFLRSPANYPRGPECLFFFVFHISTWNSTWR